MPVKKQTKRPRRALVIRGNPRGRKSEAIAVKIIPRHKQHVANYFLDKGIERVVFEISVDEGYSVTLNIPEVKFTLCYKSAAQALREIRRYSASVLQTILRHRSQVNVTHTALAQLLTPETRKK